MSDKLNMGKGGYTNWDEFLADEMSKEPKGGTTYTSTLNPGSGGTASSISQYNSINGENYLGEFHSLFPNKYIGGLDPIIQHGHIHFTHDTTDINIPNKVNHPNHYNQGKLEVIEVLKDKMSREQYKGFLLGNLLKYSMRFDHKNGVEDLEKAKVYLNWLIELEKEIK